MVDGILFMGGSERVKKKKYSHTEMNTPNIINI
jgi:hypothetical protein